MPSPQTFQDALSCVGMAPRRLWYTRAIQLRLQWAVALLVVSNLSGQELPRPTVTLGLLEKRKAYQATTAQSLRAFRDFHYTNQIESSGITFTHQIVDDAARAYKAVQYDHGNGVAAADVDGDGRIDLYFTSQLGSNELWRNLGGGRFENRTAASNLGLVDQISVAAAFGDYDNDGRPDLYVTTVRHGNHLFHNEGDGRFKDVTAESGLGYVGHSSAAVWWDYDRDGRLDLFVVNTGVYTSGKKGRGGYFEGLEDAFSGHLFPGRTENSVLYRNLGGGRFEDVSRHTGLRDGSWSGEATFTDLDDDGFPELYVANMQGDDHYYRNLGGKRFEDATSAHFPKTPWGATGVKFFDYNQDGLMDLFVTDMHSDMTRQQTEDAVGFQPSLEKRKSEAWCSAQWDETYLQGSTNNVFGNAFYVNQGGGKFAEASDTLGTETYWPWGMSAGDLNADGYPDLFITAGMGYPFRYAINSVLLNDLGKRFHDTEFLLGVEPRKNGRLGKVWFTLDCSGPDAGHSACAGKTGMVPVPGSFSSRSSAILDLDDDGDLDVVTNEFNDRPQLLISDLSAKTRVNFVQIRLVGTRSNRDGLGARVSVKAGEKSWHQFHDGKSGYLAQSSVPLYFGLGPVSELDSVEVRWPSGTIQTMKSVQANRVVIVTEPMDKTGAEVPAKRP